MIKIFYFYVHKEEYYSSSPIVNNIKILFNNHPLFNENNIELTPMLEYLPEYNKKKMQFNISIEKMNEDLSKAIENILIILPEIVNKYDKIIFLGFHPTPFQPFIRHYKKIKKYKNVKTILWQDDLHAYFTNDDRKNKLNFADHIITPSPIYFENVAPEYLLKSSFFFYSADFEENKDFCCKWENRINKIILSGCVNERYKIRADILNEITINNDFAKIADFIKKPRSRECDYDEKDKKILPFGKNYYKKLGQYKGAFFGYYEYPKNFNLAKIIEILSMGCIGFFEYSPLLEKELGLIPMIHYVPCTEFLSNDKNSLKREPNGSLCTVWEASLPDSRVGQPNENQKLITDVNYYNYYLNNIDGKGLTIAKNGKEHIKKYFSNNNGINNYLKIFKNI